MLDEIPRDFEDEGNEALRAEVADLKAKLAMMFQCIKAMSEGRKVVVHDNGQIFVRASSIIAGMN